MITARKVVIPASSGPVFTTGNIVDDDEKVLLSNIAVIIEQPLLKSAPQLLEALQLARHLLKFHQVTLDWTGHTAHFQDLIIQREGTGPINTIDAAIAKATGDTK